MEQDQEKRSNYTVLGSDPFAGMDFSDEETAAPPPEDSPANGVEDTADALDALDELEAALLVETTAEELEAELFAGEELERALLAPADLAAELPGETGEETAVPEPEETRYLDDLIASIDDRIDALYGAGDSLDLSDRQTRIPGAEEQHIIFDLAGTEYTVPIGNVLEIGRPLPITLVPNVPHWLLGVANLRGDIVSMVDLRRFLGLPPAAYERDGRMIITQSTDEEVTVGLLVDRVNGIRFLAAEQITAPTAAIEDQVAPYLRGVCEDNGRLLVVLNLDKLLLSPEMQQFESV